GLCLDKLSCSVSVVSTSEQDVTLPSIAANLARLRRQRGLSLRQLARRLAEGGQPINVDGVNRIEMSKRQVTAPELLALAVVLNVSPSTLLIPPEPDGDRDNWRAAWRWLHGELPLGWEEGRRSPDWSDRIRAFRRENRP